MTLQRNTRHEIGTPNTKGECTYCRSGSTNRETPVAEELAKQDADHSAREKSSQSSDEKKYAPSLQDRFL
jgi:hypothetical protein